ncbi:MAG: hypothetical protein HY905_08995 [Deltaproteobacteria bacterium]|nr:hypothetical protein [Deltaproteobacteria bacterium]
MTRASLVLAVAAFGCGDGSKKWAAQSDEVRVEVHESPGQLEVRDLLDHVLFETLGGGAVAEGEEPLVFAAVRHAEASVDTGFGTFRVEDRAAEPWKGVSTLGEISVDGPVISFVMLGADGERLGTGTVQAGTAGAVLLELVATDPRANRMSLGFACAPDEHFLGMGGQSWDVDHRGQKIPLWVQEDGLGKDPTDEYEGTWYVVGRRHQTHTPIPIFVSSRGYALMLETPVRSIFDFCSTDTGRGRLEAWDGRIRIRIFRGADAGQAIERMTAAVGRPDLPPMWVFAPWLDALYGSENVRRVAAKLRERGIPSSVIWTEDWRGGHAGTGGYTLEEDWRVDRALYPDFEALADDLHGLGFKFLTYNNTFVVRGSDVWDEVRANGYGIHDTAGDDYAFMGVTFTDTTLLDLSNEAAREWAKGVWGQGLALGADGWMADYAEWLPTDIVLASGEDPMAAHNLYPVEFQRLTRETLAGAAKETAWFARSGYLGSQPLVQVFWAGDQQTDWSQGDGMPSVIPMGLGLGIVGFPYFAHDIGGYQSAYTDPTTEELWYRWVSLGAMSPVMRTHHGRSAAENWNWEKDEASTEHLRLWAVRHMQLVPYLYAAAQEASAGDGLPIMRPLALRWPDWDPGWTMTDEYLLGDRIVVAPVLEQGATSRRVRLPEGTFHPLWGGETLTMPAGGGEATVAAAREECPTFVPAGTILVLLPEGADTAVDDGVTDVGVVRPSTLGDDREILVWAGGSGSFVEVGGRLRYDWVAESANAATGAATWNGAPVEPTAGAVTVAGNGTLSFAAGAVLTVEGGAGDRELTIRWGWP